MKNVVKIKTTCLIFTISKNILTYSLIFLDCMLDKVILGSHGCFLNFTLETKKINNNFFVGLKSFIKYCCQKIPRMFKD
jgi:hypothetical protein